MKPLLLFALLLLAPLLGCAQVFTVRGVVQAKADRAALAGVTVLEKATSHGTATDARGRFTLRTTTRAPRLRVSFVGYVTKEIAITKSTDSLVIVLEESKAALNEVVVTGYAAPVRRSVSGAVSSVSVVDGRVAGVMVSADRRAPAAPRAAAKATRAAAKADKTTDAAPAEMPDLAGAAEPAPAGRSARAKTLTAGELNDFGKWTLWPDVAQQDLREWRRRWQISPLARYAAQVLTEDGFPVVGATVRLRDERDSLLWQAQSDNTGKCELWNGLFANGEGPKVGSLQAVVGGKTYTLKRPKAFHDGGVNLLRVQQPCQAPAQVDIAFVVDATGSMGDEIEYLQAELGDVIAHAKDSLAATTLNLGSVFYRDAGDEYVTRKSDFSADIRQTVEFIGNQQANGGGDYPEAVDRALAVALHDLTWSPQAKARLLFLILDAPPHEDLQTLASLQASIRRAAAQGIRLIPIAASGVDKSTEYLMRAMALATNGTYVFLTDDSGVGDAHIKPTTDKFDVELLNTLLVKLITRYAYTTSCQTPAARPASTLAGRYSPPADSAAGKPRGPGYAWRCYPNPTPDVLHVELEGDVNELFVSDVTGKLVLRVVPTRHRATIELGSFPTGIYFLRFFAGDHWEQARFSVSR